MESLITGRENLAIELPRPVINRCLGMSPNNQQHPAGMVTAEERMSLLRSEECPMKRLKDPVPFRIR